MQTVKRPAAARSIAPVIPGYRLIAQLGSGGEGDVWVGERVSCKTRVALKIHRAAHTKDAQGIERVRRGFRVLKALNCQGIARAIEEGETPSGELWLSTTLIEGRTLLEHVNQLDLAARQAHGTNRRWSFPTHEVLELFQKVCDCVHLAHRVDILHRDLKPSNIIVDSHGQPWLVDFGLARERVGLHDTLVTIPGQFVGSVEYASPEQIDGPAEQIDARSDLYSLGVMLYQFLTGAFPYDVRGPLPQVFDRIRFERPTPPRRLAPWMPRDLQAVVLKAIEKQPAHRYQSVEELRDDLRRFLDGEPVRARQGGSAVAAIRFLSHHRKLAVVVATVAALSLGYSISATVLLRRAQRAEANAAAHAEAARSKFRMAQQAAERLLTHVDEKLKDRPGLFPLRREILQDAYDQFQALLQERSDDPALLADYARAHVKLSDIALELGRLDESEHHRAEALAIRRALAEAEPDNVRRQIDLSISIVLIGDVQKARGQSAKAEESYRSALEIDERLASAHPDEPELLDNLAWSYERIGAINPVTTADELKIWYEKRHAVCERLLALRPDAPASLFNLLASHVWLANPLLVDDKRVDYHLREAISIADRLMAIAPDDERYIHYYIMTQWVAGRSASKSGDREGCLAALTRALDKARMLHERDRDRVQFRQLLGDTLVNMSEAEAALGDTLKSGRTAVEAVELLTLCVKQIPDNPYTRFLLASGVVQIWSAIQQHPDVLPDAPAKAALRNAFEVLPADYAPPRDSPVFERFAACRRKYAFQ